MESSSLRRTNPLSSHNLIRRNPGDRCFLSVFKTGRSYGTILRRLQDIKQALSKPYLNANLDGLTPAFSDSKKIIIIQGSCFLNFKLPNILASQIPTKKLMPLAFQFFFTSLFLIPSAQLLTLMKTESYRSCWHKY